MRCLGRLFNEYLMPLFELIHKQYEVFFNLYFIKNNFQKKKAISSYLYLVEVSVTVFGTKLEYSEILRIIYEFMCERTLKELPKLKDFEENPYLTEDFFGMMGRFVKYAPHIALNSKTLQIALQLAEIGIGCLKKNHCISYKKE